ncbi:hypothetical protein [Agromyces sp. S2-1-8]|uniref:hypothetical protein n=1 Tax=Agromyces sp. S2-1-8 TaxID=2897180 RepID=UPI001E53D0D8|nr:hypothetical protein [Agromyces sp. S2-1-8]MCD5348396.1 hypothetical protein [Agromyces sp. S2-1-8]
MVGYAGVAALQILVWNPLAAVPGRALAEIYAEAEAAGQSLTPVVTILILGAGGCLAGLVLGFAVRGVFPGVWLMVSVYLLLLVFGAPAYFIASFSPGMSLADTYMISGGDYAPWGHVLMLVSAAALAGLVAIAVAAVVRGMRGSRGGVSAEQDGAR